MKKLVLAFLMLVISFAVISQDTLPGKKKIAPEPGHKAGFDYFLEIDGVEGESDTLPPAPAHLTVSAGGMLSQTTNSNLIARYSIEPRPGFILGIGYVLEFRKSRLQINAAYLKGGVSVASGDVDGDGLDNTNHIDMDYLTIPLQYQFYLGKNKRFYIGGGAYASYLLSSKQRETPVYEYGFKKYDFGCTGSAGTWLGSRITLQAGYNLGLVNIDPSPYNKARNGMAFISLNYSFFSKTKYGPVITIKPKG